MADLMGQKMSAASNRKQLEISEKEDGRTNPDHEASRKERERIDEKENNKQHETIKSSL
jgi:hypothetical protein